MQVQCPACEGSKRMPTPNHLRKYGMEYGWYGYSKDDDKVDCTNCGGQTQHSRATGLVNQRPDGTPCLHEYDVATTGRCLTRYTCRHCGFLYTIDSGD